jgi:hypothetical protein
MVSEAVEITEKERNFLNKLRQTIGDSNPKEMYVARLVGREFAEKYGGKTLDEIVEKHEVKTLDEILVGFRKGFPRGLVYTDRYFISTDGLEIVSVVPL